MNIQYSTLQISSVTKNEFGSYTITGNKTSHNCNTLDLNSSTQRRYNSPIKMNISEFHLKNIMSALNESNINALVGKIVYQLSPEIIGIEIAVNGSFNDGRIPYLPNVQIRKIDEKDEAAKSVTLYLRDSNDVMYYYSCSKRVIHSVEKALYQGTLKGKFVTHSKGGSVIFLILEYPVRPI